MTKIPHKNNLMKRLRLVGIALVVAGLALAGVSFAYGVPTADAGLDSAQAMYEAQGVTLSYNDDDQLVDRGTVAGAQAIMDLLEKEWKFPVNHANFDPNDPLVNTRDELMYQYAAIVYHTLKGERDVVLAESDVPITYRGLTYADPGTYKIAVGDYFGNLDRSHPIERQLREAWTPLALGLLASLAGGHANQAAGELALMTSYGLGAIGLIFALGGAGLVWATFARTEPIVQVRSAGPAPARAHPAVGPRGLAPVQNRNAAAVRGTVRPPQNVEAGTANGNRPARDPRSPPLRRSP